MEDGERGIRLHDHEMVTRRVFLIDPILLVLRFDFALGKVVCCTYTSNVFCSGFQVFGNGTKSIGVLV